MKPRSFAAKRRRTRPDYQGIVTVKKLREGDFTFEVSASGPLRKAGQAAREEFETDLRWAATLKEAEKAARDEAVKAAMKENGK